ncbi:MAG: CBS domain-containing protein [Actinomycetes bacterium]
MVDAPSVAEVMSAPVVTVRDTDTVWQAVDQFMVSGLRHLVVVDGARTLVGVLSDRVAMGECRTAALTLRTRQVTEVLQSYTQVPCEVTPALNVREAARLMLARGDDALPVVDAERRPVGIVTGSDLLRALRDVSLEQPEESEQPSGT